MDDSRKSCHCCAATVHSAHPRGQPRVEVDHSRPINKNAERFDGTVREGESVAEYQRRVLGQIKSSKGEDEPRL